MNKLLSKIKYPKLLLLMLSFVLAYILFKGRGLLPFRSSLLSLGYIGTFLAGVFFAYGFTAAPATAILLILSKEQSIILAGFIAGFGALVGDLIIFKLIRHSFAEELAHLSKGRIATHLRKTLPESFRKYFIPILAGFIIASPLPDEIGVSLLAASTNIKTRAFYILSFLLNTSGIFVILILGSLT